MRVKEYNRAAGHRVLGEASIRTAKSSLEVKSILIPVDFSLPSQGAFELALKLAGVFHARVHLLHVVEDRTTPDFDKFPIARSNSALLDGAKRKLVAWARESGHPDVPVYPDVRRGTPWLCIIEQV